MLRKSFYLFCCSMSSVSFLQAQEIDTLAGTVITGKNEQESMLHKQQVNDRLKQAQALVNLDQLLAQSTSAFIRSYGFNNMSTLSVRGSSAAQNATIWNGIPIQNAANGVSDLSLINGQLIDDIHITSSGDNNQISSNKLGGIVQLDPVNRWNSNKLGYRHQVMANTGSYAQYKASYNGTWQDKITIINLRLLYKTAENNFTYTDKQNNQLEMQNAAQLSKAGILNTWFKLDTLGNHFIKLSYWIQGENRAIPRALFETNSTKYLEENHNRIAINHVKSWRLYELKNTLGFTHQTNIYNDTAIHTYLNYALEQYAAQVNFSSKYIATHQWNSNWGIALSGLLNTIQTKHVYNSYDQHQVQSNLWYTLNSLNKKWSIKANVNQAYIRDKWAPLLPSLAINYNSNIEKTLQHKVWTMIQKSYRYPTLNELYFFPGGNANLLPEEGWSYELGYKGTVYADKSIFKLEATGYYKNIDNWIYWLGGAIWTPHNIAKVNSRGLEVKGSYTYRHNDWEWSISGNYAYTRATTAASNIPNDKSIGKQIPYVPIHVSNLIFSLKYKQSQFLYTHQYTGIRNITNDASSTLAAYQLGNLSIAQTFTHRKHSFTLTGTIYNIWNTEYTVVNARPMPGRNYEITIKHNLY